MSSVLASMTVLRARPAMLTAPDNAGTAARRMTTSTVLVTPLNVPADRMISVALASMVGDVSMAGRVVALSPVNAVSAAPLSLRIVTLTVPRVVAPPTGGFAGPASASHGCAAVAPRADHSGHDRLPRWRPAR